MAFQPASNTSTPASSLPSPANPAPRPSPRRKTAGAKDSAKRRCISTACIACRRRKSKCDGQLPSCAACALVYGTECVYDPGSDHRRKGASSTVKPEGKKRRSDNDNVSARHSTDVELPREDSHLEVLMKAILEANEDDAYLLVKEIRISKDLVALADTVSNRRESETLVEVDDYLGDETDGGEREVRNMLRDLRLENGSVRYIGGTSHLMHEGEALAPEEDDSHSQSGASLNTSNPLTSWTEVTDDADLVSHLMDMYLNYHYPYFTTLSRRLFWRDFTRGRLASRRGHTYCSSLLVNAMLALGCHFTDVPGACAVPGDTSTKGDHFFDEAKRLLFENDEYEKAQLVTVQALALMSVREAGCGREARGWAFSGMSFRMAQDMGLNVDAGEAEKHMSDEEIDARRITFWGCFLFDKCWSNYLGRLPQLHKMSFNVGYIDVFPDEDSEPWAPLSDKGFDMSRQQPARTRGIAVNLFKLCEISSDLLVFFYHPTQGEEPKGKWGEMKKLDEVYQRLEAWRKELPKEFEPRAGSLPNLILVQ